MFLIRFYFARLFVFAFVFLSFFIPVVAGDLKGENFKGENIRVLVSHAVLNGIAKELTVNSIFEIVSVTPARLPANRHALFLAGRGYDNLILESKNAQAVITMRSVFPQDVLYSLSRRGNIRLVEIDAANPIEGDLAGVIISNDSKNNQVWQNADNLVIMSGIIVNALARLDYSQNGILQENLSKLKKRLQNAQIVFNNALSKHNEPFLYLLSDNVKSFADFTQLEVISGDVNDALKLNNVLFVSNKEIEGDLLQDIKNAGAGIIIISENAVNPIDELSNALNAIAEFVEKK